MAMIDGLLSGVEIADEDRLLFVDVLPNTLIGAFSMDFDISRRARMSFRTLRIKDLSSLPHSCF